MVRPVDLDLPTAYEYLNDILIGNEEVDDIVWMKIVCTFMRTSPAGTTEDRAQLAMHFLNITGGNIDSSWTTADFNSLGGPFGAWWTSVKPLVSSNTTWDAMKFYKMAFDPADPGPGHRTGSGLNAFRDTGPPAFQILGPQAGASGFNSAYQIAATCTFKTALPKHWGRIYLPGAGSLDANGRITAANAKLLADACHDLADATAALGFLHVVPMASLDKQRFHALLGVDAYQVDDIPDVVRRRRPRQAAARTIGI
jgi:hypothetical protein